MKLRTGWKLGLLVGVVAWGLGACAGAMDPVKIEGDLPSVAKLDSLAVVEFTVSPPSLPTFPLIDAGIYNSRVNTLAPQILALHKEQVDGYAEAFGQALTRYAKGKIQSGKSLTSTDAYHALAAGRVAVFSRKLDNSTYPEAIEPAETLNFLDYAKLDNSSDALDRGYLDKHSDVGPRMAQVAKALGVDAVALASVSVVHGAGPFGISGYRACEVRMLLFDRAGHLLVAVKAYSDGSSAGATNFEDYASALGKFSATADLMARRVYGADGQGTKTASVAR